VKDGYYISGVYLIFNEVTGASYIGSSNRIQYRWTQHKKELKHQYHKNPKLQASWNKYGKAAFGFFIVEYVSDDDRLLEREKHYIEKYEGRYLLNICRDPQRQRLGIAHTDETKKKISAIHKGRRLTAEHKANISAGMRSPEAFAKMSASRRGKPQPSETNLKRSLTMKTKANSPEWIERCRALGRSLKGRKPTTAISPATRKKTLDCYKSLLECVKD
jgi:group I intron endonuclease